MAALRHVVVPQTGSTMRVARATVGVLRYTLDPNNWPDDFNGSLWANFLLQFGELTWRQFDAHSNCLFQPLY